MAHEGREADRHLGIGDGDWLLPDEPKGAEVAALQALVDELRLTIRSMARTIANQAQYISRMT